MRCLRKHSRGNVARPQFSARVYAALKQGQSASSKLKHKEKLLQVFHNREFFPLDVGSLPLSFMLNAQQWIPALDLGTNMFIWCVILLGSFKTGLSPGSGRRGKQKCSFDACLRADYGSQYHTVFFLELSSYTALTVELVVTFYSRINYNQTGFLLGTVNTSTLTSSI